MTSNCLLWLGFCSVLGAQTPAAFSVNPAVVNYSIRSPKIYPGWQYMAPQKKILTIQTTQPWTLTLGGQLNSACLYFSACFQVTEEYSSIPVTSGIGSRRLAVNWYGSQGPDLSPGNYSGLITFNVAGSAASAVVTVNLQVAAAADLPATSLIKPTPVSPTGCAYSDPLASYTFAVRCDPPNEAPTADPALTQPAVGKSFVDPVFGGRITRITPPGCSTEYGTTTAFSAKSTYIWNSCGVFRTADASLVGPVNANISLTTMSAIDDQSYFYFAGSQIRQYNFVTATDTLLGDFGGPPWNFQSLYAGGTASASSDDWLAFFEYETSPFPKICAVNLPALKTAGGPNAANTYCGTYRGALPMESLDWVAISETDDVSGKRYVYLSSVPVSAVFSVGVKGSGTLTQEYIVPEWPGWDRNNDDGVCLASEICYSASNFSHISLFKDRDGQIKLFGNYQDILLNRNYLSTYRLSAGLNLLRLEEAGGGHKFLGRFEWDTQPGCSSLVAACSVSGIETVQRFAARVLRADAAPGATTLTLSAAPGWDPGTRAVRIQNGEGAWSCLNGAWNATVVAGNLVSVPASCAGAAGPLDKVMLGDAVQPFAAMLNDNRGQIQVWRPERQIRQVAMHRSVQWVDVPDTGISSYGSSPRASISRDGRFVAFNSNWGSLDFDGESVYIVATGLGDPADKITIRSLTPATNSAALSYTAGATQSCTIELAADPGFQNMVETFIDPASAGTRLTYLGRTVPLNAGSNYWLRMQCGTEVESKYFRTPAIAAPSTRIMTLQVAAVTDEPINDVVVEYRIQGGGLFSVTPGFACAAGCKVFWPVDVGSSNEYRLQYRDGAGNIRQQSEIRTVVPAPSGGVSR